VALYAASDRMHDATASVPAAHGRAASALGAAAIIAYWAATQLWGVGEAPFHTKGEPREALVVWEMVHGGGWVLPRRNGIELPSKPPLFHWLGALASLGHGNVDEWSTRLPSVLQSGVAALALYAATVPSLGPAAAAIAAAALLGSFEWMRAATSARVDMTLTCGFSVALAALLALRRSARAEWRWLYHASVAWAVVSKGPVGLALPVLHVSLLCVLERRLDLLRRLRPLRGLLLIVLVGATWYALAIALGGEAFVRKQLLGENVQRFLGSSAYRAGHAHPWEYLMGALLAGLLPWTIFLPAVLADWRAAVGSRDQRGLFSCLLVWAMVVFVFYAFAASKRGVYLLPLYPTACVLLGWWAAQPPSGGQRWLRYGVAPLVWGIASAAALIAIGVTAQRAGVPLLPAIANLLPPRDAQPLVALAGLSPPALETLAALAAAATTGTVIAAVAAGTGRRRAAIGGLLVAVAAGSAAAQRVVLPAVAQAKSRAAFVRDVRRVIETSPDLFFYRSFDYGVTFYWNGHLPVHPQPLTASGPRYVVIGDADWRHVNAEAHRAYERITTLESSKAGNLGRLYLVQRTRSASADHE
jgi:4-amino-4-deoxy-L-arabinose transferase-like glycosyltransferase